MSTYKALSLIALISLPCMSHATNESMQNIFNYIYDNLFWGKMNPPSGGGSRVDSTTLIRKALPGLVKEFNIKIFLDAPCGDFTWMQVVNMDIEKYIGCDIVPKMIAVNQKKYGNDIREFMVLDVTEDEIPYADLILCRDCLVHFPYDDIFKAIRNFKKSGSKYLLTTTFINRKSNYNIDNWGVKWHPINLQKPPFNFPKPIRIIKDHKDGKSLGLWKIADLPSEQSA